MLVCRKSSNGGGTAQRIHPQAEAGKRRRKLGEAGPVFYPRRKPSALAERLLASESLGSMGGTSKAAGV